MGICSTTVRVDGPLPHLLPIGLDNLPVEYRAKDFPLRVELPEHHAGLDALFGTNCTRCCTTLAATSPRMGSYRTAQIIRPPTFTMESLAR